MGFAIAAVVLGLILMGPRGAIIGFIAWYFIAEHPKKSSNN